MTVGETRVPITLRIPEGMISAQLVVDVGLDPKPGGPGIVRCRIADGEVEGETAAEVGDTSTLLADPADPHVAAWRAGVEEFARLLPEVSHREPAPSDRDPIPAPFDNAYNKPERNHFHTAIKYHRDDDFFVEHIADDATRRGSTRRGPTSSRRSNTTTRTSEFAARKFGLDLGGRVDRRTSTAGRSTGLPAEPRRFVRHLDDEFDAMQRPSATPSRATSRTPCGSPSEPGVGRSPGDEERLRAFYARLRRRSGLDHRAALRALLARVLVAPAFLYRAEPPEAVGAGSCR